MSDEEQQDENEDRAPIPEDRKYTLNLAHLSDGTWTVEVVDHEGTVVETLTGLSSRAEATDAGAKAGAVVLAKRLLNESLTRAFAGSKNVTIK